MRCESRQTGDTRKNRSSIRTEKPSRYTPASQHLAADLSGPTGPLDPVLARLDPLLATPIALTDEQIDQLVAFVRGGLLYPRATPEHLRRLIPRTVPSGRPMLTFEFK